MTAPASVHSDLSFSDIDNPPLKKLSNKESCIKCQKGGNLLVCNHSDCAIVVHESCIFSFCAQFDDNSKFFCPYCFYKQSVFECRQAKEKALLAKQALSRFLDMNNGNLECCTNLKRKEPDSPTNMQNRNDVSGSKVETDEAGHQPMQEEGGQQDNCPELETLTGYEQEAGAAVSSHCLEKGTASRKYENLTKKPQETVKTLGLYHIGSKGREQAQAELQETSVYLATKENTTDIHEELPKGSDSTSRDDSCLTSQIALTSENAGQPAEFGFMVTGHTSRQKVDDAKETQRPPLPSTRRRKLPWTLEEVEMLKEGVQKFSLVANKNLPWMKILEFGRHIFDGTRTPVDLKDKWRNLMGKGTST